MMRIDERRLLGKRAESDRERTMRIGMMTDRSHNAEPRPERMNSPLENREIRLRGLVRCARSLCTMASRRPTSPRVFGGRCEPKRAEGAPAESWPHVQSPVASSLQVPR
jgi:hypothetical protein